MSDFVTLTCPNCGGKLKVTSDINRFACSHCGMEQSVKRGEGIISLSPVMDAIARVQSSVDVIAEDILMRKAHENEEENARVKLAAEHAAIRLQYKTEEEKAKEKLTAEHVAIRLQYKTEEEKAITINRLKGEVYRLQIKRNSIAVIKPRVAAICSLMAALFICIVIMSLNSHDQPQNSSATGFAWIVIMAFVLLGASRWIKANKAVKLIKEISDDIIENQRQLQYYQRLAQTGY